MPLPTQGDLRPVDPVMSDLSIGFKNDMYYWDKIAPDVSRTEKSGTYFEWTKDYWLRRAPGAARAPSAPYTRIGMGVTTGTYNTEERGFEEPVYDPIRASSQTPESLDVMATKHLTEVMQLELEKTVSNALWKTGVWATDKTLSGTGQWSDQTSDPIGDMDTAKRVVMRGTGTKPDTLFIGGVVWDTLKEHTQIIEKYKYSQAAVLTEELVARALGVNKIYVMESVENTAQDGSTYSGADIWTDRGLLTKMQQSPGLMAPNGAYTFMWDEKGNVPWAMQNYREEQVRSDVHRIFTHLDVKVCANDWGYFFNDTLA